MKKSSYVHPLSLGSLTLPVNVLYAPLAGCSDYPFRKINSFYRPGLTFCEMVKMDALIRHDENTYHLLDYDTEMHPIGAQLCGSKPSLAGPCAKIIEDLGFDVVDLNCGCPVDKVTKDGSGSGMLKNPDLIGEVLYQMIKSVDIPVTVKIRVGWDSEHINAKDITKIAESAGAKAITIHGRTRAQGYKGPANWDYIKECVAVAKEIKVIGNGDVMDGPSAQAIFDKTGCDGILVARGTMGKPWVVQDILHYLFTGQLRLPTPQDIREAFLRHMDITLSYENDRYALLAMRRIACWYLKEGKGARSLREGINKAKTLDELQSLIHHYDWSSISLQEPQEAPSDMALL
jgi:nifR3 family TIM-barrel protein